MTSNCSRGRFGGNVVGWLGGGVAAAVAALLLLAAPWGSNGSARAADPAPTAAGSTGDLELVFAYGSEKEEWVNWATLGGKPEKGTTAVKPANLVNPAAFNLTDRRTKSGRRIRVKPIPMGSGEAVEDVLAGRVQAHLLSPASAVFVDLVNAEAKKLGQDELIGQTENLVLSPVVIAMWRPMAEALGWPLRKVGWSDIFALTSKPNGWAALGAPQYDPFRFGHTHPDLSNSGMIALLAEAYFAAGKSGDLTVEDVTKPEAVRQLEAVERGVVYYGRSTGFFGKKMFKGGPDYLSAAVLYENMVIESYDKAKYKPALPVVAIYPKEGTFMSDHPVGVVERPHVTPDHREAARAYVDFLLAAEQQRQAMAYGFRPGKENIPLASPLDAAHGIDPTEPTDQLRVPPVPVVEAIRSTWADRCRKKTSITLVLDRSGSMNIGGRMVAAKGAARELLKKLKARDYFSFFTFSDSVQPEGDWVKLSVDRAACDAAVGQVVANGQTALYDAIAAAYDYAQSDAQKDMIPAIVVLTDGNNNVSGGRQLATAEENNAALRSLLRKIAPDPHRRPVKIITIAYSLDARKEDDKQAIAVLQYISDMTDGTLFEADPNTINQIIRKIQEFF